MPYKSCGFGGVCVLDISAFRGFALQKKALNNGTRLRDITGTEMARKVSGCFRGDFCTGPVPLFNSLFWA